MKRALLHRAEQVAHHREAAALDAREQKSRPAGRTDAAMNLGRFEPGIDLGIDPHELPGAFQSSTHSPACDNPSNKAEYWPVQLNLGRQRKNIRVA